jgi:hypothetical protein
MTSQKFIDNLSSVSIEDRTKFANSKVRGKAIINTLAYVKLNFDKEGYEKLISSLEISSQILLRKKLVENDWYQLAILIELNINIVNLFLKGDVKKLQSLGEYGGESLLSLMKQIKLRMSDIQATAEFIKETLEWYYLPATITIKTCEEKHLAFEFNHLFDPSHSIIERFTGIIKTILKKRGFAHIEVTAQTLKKPEDSYLIQAIWAD